MSYLEIRQRIEQACKLGGWSNVDPPPDFSFIANRGLKEFVRLTGGNIETSFISLVANQVSYSTFPNDPALNNYDPRIWCNIWDSMIYQYQVDNPGGGWYLPQITLNKLRQYNIQYMDTPVGQPECWYFDKGNTNTIAFYPPPSQTGIVCMFNGVRELPVMVNDDDMTPFSEVYDEAIAGLGVWWYAQLYTRANERAVAAQYKARADELITEFKHEMTGSEAAFINRRVALPPQPYMQTGTQQVPVYPAGPYYQGNLNP